jgi:hypothetical protein
MRLNRIVVASIVAILLAPATSIAQPPADPRPLADRLQYIDIASAMTRAAAATTDRDKRLELLSALDVLSNNLPAFVYYARPQLTLSPEVLKDTFYAFLLTAQKARVDQQMGLAGATSSAATTGVAQLIGFALETGAVSQTLDQNVATFRANADGLKRFLSNEDVFPVPCTAPGGSCDTAGFLKNLEVSASFNFSDSTVQPLKGTSPAAVPVSFSALINQHQFVSATARYAVENPRDLRSENYRTKWREWFEKTRASFAPASADLLTVAQQATDIVMNNDDNGVRVSGDRSRYGVWREATLRAFQNAGGQSPAEWQALLRDRLDVLLKIMRTADPNFDKSIADLSASFLKFAALRRDLESTLVVDPALTLEYTYSELPLQPKLHTGRIVYAYSPGRAHTNPGTITFNAGVDYYHYAQSTGTPGQTSHWKDATAAVQFDRPLGPAGATTQLSVGAYYQYQMMPNTFIIPKDATTLPGTQIPLPPGSPVLSEAGSIFATQAVLTIQLGSSGIKIPLGISWANRTELAVGNEVRGHIGVTIDTSALSLLAGGR